MDKFYHVVTFQAIIDIYHFLSWTYLDHSLRNSKILKRVLHHSKVAFVKLECLRKKPIVLLFFCIATSQTQQTWWGGMENGESERKTAMRNCSHVCSQQPLEDHVAALPWQLQGARPIRGSHFLKLFLSKSHRVLFYSEIRWKEKKKNVYWKKEKSFQDDVYSHKDGLHILEV